MSADDDGTYECSKFGRLPTSNDSFMIDSDNTNWGGFGIYIAYIFAFVILTFFLDKFKLFDRWVHELSLKSQEHLHPYVLRQRHVDPEDSNRKNAEHETHYEGECCDCMFGGKERCSSEISQYKVEYLSYLLDAPVYLAVAPVESTIKDETVINLCWCWPIRIAPKLFSDILLYNFNKHSLLGMFATTKGHPFSRAEKRSAFLCQTCMALGFGILVSQLTAYEKLLLNIFLISPTMIALNTALYYLLACPCFRTCKERGGCAKCFVSCLEGLGWFIAVPIALSCISFLLGMAIVTSGNPSTSLNVIASFAYSVHVVSSIQEAFMSFLIFLNGRHCFHIKVCCMKVMTLGKYFEEKIHLAEWEENKHYYKSEWRLCGCSCLITIVHFGIIDDPSSPPTWLKPSKIDQVVPLNDDNVAQVVIVVDPSKVTETEKVSSKMNVVATVDVADKKDNGGDDIEMVSIESYPSSPV